MTNKIKMEKFLGEYEKYIENINDPTIESSRDHIIDMINDITVKYNNILWFYDMQDRLWKILQSNPIRKSDRFELTMIILNTLGELNDKTDSKTFSIMRRMYQDNIFMNLINKKEIKIKKSIMYKNCWFDKNGYHYLEKGEIPPFSPSQIDWNLSWNDSKIKQKLSPKIKYLIKFLFGFGIDENHDREAMQLLMTESCRLANHSIGILRIIYGSPNTGKSTWNMWIEQLVGAKNTGLLSSDVFNSKNEFKFANIFNKCNVYVDEISPIINDNALQTIKSYIRKNGTIEANRKYKQETTTSIIQSWTILTNHKIDFPNDREIIKRIRYWNVDKIIYKVRKNYANLEFLDSKEKNDLFNILNVAYIKLMQNNYDNAENLFFTSHDKEVENLKNINDLNDLFYRDISFVAEVNKKPITHLYKYVAYELGIRTDRNFNSILKSKMEKNDWYKYGTFRGELGIVKIGVLIDMKKWQKQRIKYSELVGGE